jgi:phosphonate transport system substrate-binding protein
MADRATPPLRLALAPTVGAAAGARLARAQALRRFLEAEMNCPVEIVIEPSYDSCVAALRSGHLDAAMLGEFAYWRARERAPVEALVIPVGDDGSIASYESVIVTVRGAGITTLSSVRGATLGLVDTASASGYLIPRAMLREAGIDPDHEVTIRLFGSHRQVIDALLDGAVAVGGVHAGAVTPPRPELAVRYARLQELARSRPIPRGPLVVRATLPPATRAALAGALLRIHEADPDAAKVLNVGGGQRFIHSTGGAPPTLRRIAALAGVSYATVSRVVNGASEVAPATAARVRAIIDELGYRPNGNALLLRGERAPLVGFLVPTPPDPASLRLADLVRHALHRAGVPLVLCPVDGAVADTPFPDLLLDGRLGALICPPPFHGDPGLLEAVRTDRLVLAVGDPNQHGQPEVRSSEEVAALLIERLGHPASHELTASHPRRARSGRARPRGTPA